jgi:ribokinase
VRVADGSTMVGVILVDATGENRIAIAPGVLSVFGAADLAGLDDVLPTADVLVVGLEIPVPTAVAALEAGRRHGVTTVLNPAPAPPEPLPPDILALVDHLLPNRTEAARLTGLPADSDPFELIASPALADVPTVVLTLGADGALVRSGDGVTTVPAVPVADVVDTTGAGDTFSAAYSVQLGQGAHPLAAARFAARAAAHCVGIAEVIPSLPYDRDLARTAYTMERNAS